MLYLIGNFFEWLSTHQFELKKVFSERIRLIAITGGVSFLFSLFNPYGIKLYLYIYRTLTSSWIVNATREYHSPNFHGTLVVIVYALVILFMIFISFNTEKRLLDIPKILILLLWVHLSLFAIRNIAIFSVVFVPCFALVLQSYLDRFSSKFLYNVNNNLKNIENTFKYHFN